MGAGVILLEWWIGFSIEAVLEFLLKVKFGI
jgi:hypothetical protein